MFYFLNKISDPAWYHTTKSGLMYNYIMHESMYIQKLKLVI